MPEDEEFTNFINAIGGAGPTAELTCLSRPPSVTQQCVSNEQYAILAVTNAQIDSYNHEIRISGSSRQYLAANTIQETVCKADMGATHIPYSSLLDYVAH